MEKVNYIAVDLDGCLAYYDEWKGPYVIGAPIKRMVTRMKKMMANGQEFKIFTARVANDKSGKIALAIKSWCKKHLGKELEVTNSKDEMMTELWDDRARRVSYNKGVFESTVMADVIGRLKQKLVVS